MLDTPDAFAAQLQADYEREASLAQELGKVKAENAELQTKLQKVSQSLKNAKVTAREALIEMADQNAKLVQAFVDKKRECKQLKAAAREDRKGWQQRLQTMELELQSNKQHIQQLMQQLHVVAAKQVPFRQPDLDTVLPSARSQPSVQLRSRGAAVSAQSTSSSSSHSSTVSSSMHAGSSLRSDQQDNATSQDTPQQAPAPFADATNRAARNSRWQQQTSSALHGLSPTGSIKELSCSKASAAGAENSPPNAETQTEQALGSQQQQQKREQPADQAALVQQPSLQPGQQQQQQQQKSIQQRQYQELQQRAKQLEAENAQLKSAQAVAAAQIDSMRLTQQAENLKQQGNRSFQAQDYHAAAAAYSGALALGITDTSLTAVLLCNRAAAQHAAGQFLDAIADCCLAHQLDPNNLRALQRRAEAYMAVQHFSAAVADLQQLVQQSGPNKDVAARLASAQAKQRAHGDMCPNHYLVLGLDAGASCAEVKAAYKRLALKHHPDKATGPEAKAAAESVFVLITAANSVLSNICKRAAYDAAYARGSLLYGRSAAQPGYYSRSTGASSSHHNSSSGSGPGLYAWQQCFGTGPTQARAAAAAAASRQQPQQWQQGAFHHASAAAPADSCNSANSSSSCASGTSFSGRQASSMRY